MSLARARAILESSGSIAKGRAVGSSLCRSSSTSAAIRVSSAPICVLGSGGGGPGGGPGGAEMAQAESASAAKRKNAARIISARNDLEQAGCAHAAADAHGHHAQFGPAPP